MCSAVGCMNLLYWHSVWEGSTTFPTINTTPFSTYYHIGTSDNIWWLNTIDRCPPYSGDLGDRHALLTHAAAQRLRNYLDFLGNTTATKRDLFRHRYMLSVVVAWGPRICVGVDIWGRFCMCRMCRFYMYRVHVVIPTNPLRIRPSRPQKRNQHKILG